MDEQNNELIAQEQSAGEAQRPETEPNPKRPANMHTHYLLRILVGGYLAYLGWQLIDNFIKGAAQSAALNLVAGGVFLLCGVGLAIWSVLLLIRGDE